MAPLAEPVLVWGAGGHGKVVAELIRACGHSVVGFVDGDPEKLGQRTEPGGGRVVVGEDQLRALLAAGGKLPGGAEAVVPAVGANRDRFAVIGVLGERLTPALVHPAATVSPSAELGAGTVVLAGAVVNSAARIGRGVIVNTSAIVEHDCVIEDGAHVSPGAVLSGGVRVGQRSWIGAGSVVIEGRLIGRDAIVGAGAIVIRDVPDNSKVVGNPARPQDDTRS